MPKARERRSGQAIVMVTLMLVAMCGILGLAVDLGWSFYVKKNAQAAADAGALSAVAEAKKRATGSPPYNCGNSGTTTLYCTAGGPVDCSAIAASSNLYNACQYATENGFTSGGNTTVTVDADIVANRPPPTVTGVVTYYWVTVRVSRRIPQLFSAVMGNTEGTSASRATAALADVIFDSSLDLLNRQNDPNPDSSTGVNLDQQGNGVVEAPGGMLLASNIPGAALQGGQQARVQNTPFSYFRGGGTCVPGGGGACNWQNPWSNGKSDGPGFRDPTEGKDQPSLQPLLGAIHRQVTVNNSGKAILGAGNPPGVIGSGTAADPYILPAGDYYAVSCSGGTCTPTGGRLEFDNNYYKFQDSTSFAQYTFYGGLKTAGGSANIQFSPGRYVFAGTTGGNPNFEIDNGTVLRDTYSGQSNYPGEIFIFTKPSYTANGTSIPLDHTYWQDNHNITFDFGESGFKAGASSNTSFNLHGLDKNASPAELRSHAPFLLWQDRGNSFVQYAPANGTVLYDGLNGNGCSLGSMVPGAGSIDNPCRQLVQDTDAPRMYLQATPNTQLSGAVYQPRGAYLRLQGGGSINGPLRIVSGALNIQGGPGVILTGIGAPITVLKTALIE